MSRLLYHLNLKDLPEAVMLGRIRQPLGWSNRGRTAPTNLLIIITEGSIVFQPNGNQLCLTEGDCILLPEGTFYTASCKEVACEYVFIHFKMSQKISAVSEDTAASITQQLLTRQGMFRGEFPYALPPTAYDGVLLQQKTVLGARMDSVLHLVSKCEGYQYESSLNNKMRIDLCITQLLLSLSLDTIDGTVPMVSTPATLSKILIFIQQNYSRRITLQELSHVFSLSKQYIIRMFHQHLNSTVTQYINNLKLYNSLELLKYSTLKVGEVADVLGFSSTYYFCRLFKRRYHCTPSEYIQSELEAHPHL